VALHLNDLEAPITLDQVMECRPEMLWLARGVLWDFVDRDPEDFLHDFYLVDRRRQRVAKWCGKCKLSSWVRYTMLYYRSNITKAWQAKRPTFDYLRPWATWTDSTTVEYDIPMIMQEYQTKLSPEGGLAFAHLSKDNHIRGLATLPSAATGRAQALRVELQSLGGLNCYDCPVNTNLIGQL